MDIFDFVRVRSSKMTFGQTRDIFDFVSGTDSYTPKQGVIRKCPWLGPRQEQEQGAKAPPPVTLSVSVLAKAREKIFEVKKLWQDVKDQNDWKSRKKCRGFITPYQVKAMTQRSLKSSNG